MAEVNVQEILNLFQKIDVNPHYEPLHKEFETEHFPEDVQKYLNIMSDSSCCGRIYEPIKMPGSIFLCFRAIYLSKTQFQLLIGCRTY